MKVDQGQWVWLKDEVESWVVASQVAKNPDGTYVVQKLSGATMNLKKDAKNLYKSMCELFVCYMFPPDNPMNRFKKTNRMIQVRR